MPKWSSSLRRAVLWTALLLLAAVGGVVLAVSQKEAAAGAAETIRRLGERLREQLISLWTWGADPAGFGRGVFMTSRF